MLLRDTAVEGGWELIMMHRPITTIIKKRQNIILFTPSSAGLYYAKDMLWITAAFQTPQLVTTVFPAD